jgi:hypothetical protein
VQRRLSEKQSITEGGEIMANNLKKGYKKPPLGSGQRFAAVSGSVQSEYIKKGYSPKKASQIGAAVAAKAGRAKYGNEKMATMAKKGK